MSKAGKINYDLANSKTTELLNSDQLQMPSSLVHSRFDTSSKCALTHWLAALQHILCVYKKAYYRLANLWSGALVSWFVKWAFLRELAALVVHTLSSVLKWETSARQPLVILFKVVVQYYKEGALINEASREHLNGLQIELHAQEPTASLKYARKIYKLQTI